MDERLERLAGLSLRPPQLALELAAARDALPSHPGAPRYARAVLAALSLLADVAVCVAGSLWKLAVSWSCAFAAVRLLHSTWDLPAGPWWTWGLLLGFDPGAIVSATAIVVVAIVLLIATCKGFAQLLHAALAGSRAPMPRTRTLVAAALLAGSSALLSCRGRAGADVAADCGHALRPSSLGSSWWRLDCPATASENCQVRRGSEEVAIAPGHQLIVAAKQVQRIDFMPTWHHCAAEVVLAGEGVAGPQSPPAIVKVEPITLQPASITSVLSMDEQTRRAVENFTAAMQGVSTQLRNGRAFKLDVSGRLEANLPKEISATLQLPQLQPALGSFDRFLGEYTRANDIAARASRVQDVCSTSRNARTAADRMKFFLYSDPDCLAALAARRHDDDQSVDAHASATKGQP